MRRERLAAVVTLVAGAALAGCAGGPGSGYSTFIGAERETVPPPPAAAALPEDSGCAVYFDVNSAAIRADQTPTIDRCAALYGSAQAHLSLEGHADERGGQQHNLSLGQRRAEAVRDELVQRGIPADRISVVSLGEESFPEIRGDDLLWSRSRRVDFALR